MRLAEKATFLNTHTLKANPILVETYRGHVAESFHRGVICAVDAAGNTIYAEGDTTQICYPRSAMKFFQHIPMLLSGAAEHYNITDEELAIFCGSHNGEQAHVNLVQNILNRIGLHPDALQCGAQAPTLKEDIAKLYEQKLKPQRIHNNCSGKHTGFLLYCLYKGYDIASYIHPQHPAQKEIMDACAMMYEYPVEKMQIGVDGCSAPIFSVPVYNQALGYKNLVAPDKFSPAVQQACKRIVEAVSQHPFMVAGSKRYCTDLMKAAGDKVIGKTGADGVYCLALKKEKIGICIKIDDGKMGPQYNVAQRLLENTGLLHSETCELLAKYITEEQKNFGGMHTGETTVSKEISFKINL